MDVRDAVTAIWYVIQLGRDAELAAWHQGDRHRTWREIRSLVAYGSDMPSRRRRTPMDVQKAVAGWVPVIRGLSTAHTPEERDACEFVIDEHLAPLLAAPVAQLREFYAALVAALKADPTIPMFVWTAFEAWETVVLKKASDSEVKHLKTEMATRIADLVEGDAKADLRSALIGALQWRSPEALEAVETAVRSGGKVRMKGRESCLFLEVRPPGADPESEPLARVML